MSKVLLAGLLLIVLGAVLSSAATRRRFSLDALHAYVVAEVDGSPRVVIDCFNWDGYAAAMVGDPEPVGHLSFSPWRVDRGLLAPTRLETGVRVQVRGLVGWSPADKQLALADAIDQATAVGWSIGFDRASLLQAASGNGVAKRSTVLPLGYLQNALIVGLVLALSAVIVRKEMPGDSTRCPGCGYDNSLTPGPVCPECARPLHS